MHQKFIMFMFLFCLLPQCLFAAAEATNNEKLTPGAMLILGKDKNQQNMTTAAPANDAAETIGASNLGASAVKKPVPAKKWVGIHVDTKASRVYIKKKVKPPVKHTRHVNHSHLHATHVQHKKVTQPHQVIKKGMNQ